MCVLMKPRTLRKQLIVMYQHSAVPGWWKAFPLQPPSAGFPNPDADPDRDDITASEARTPHHHRDGGINPSGDLKWPKLHATSFMARTHPEIIP
ncbi:hypothetical protein VTO42DRAFT_1398 [Malbranchea cinnamomea]